MSGRIVLLGATGYTGGIVLDALLGRGLEPILAGRNRDALAALAERGGGLDYRLADVTDPASIANLVERGDVLISTVGPFERYGHPVARAAADTGAHYIDSTGEVGFVAALRRTLHDRARETGAVMVPAFGYDYVPGFLAATLAARQVGEPVRSIDIGYFATGPLGKGLSQGTRTTMRDGLTLPSPRWSGGRLVDARTGSKIRAFEVRGRRKNATLVSGTEVLFLPQDLPSLESVTVYNGWFPALSRPMVVMSAVTSALNRIALGRTLIDVATRPMIGPVGGPGATERARTRSHVVAVAAAASGRTSEVHVEGLSAYSLTGELMAWAAQRLASAPARTAGVVGPVEAFGFEELAAGCAEVGLVPV
ncbi:saccharopine dehydrogenase family protein [Nocardia cyriacigeorgica]|uniref:saccharopine dehydrogenase family protein n=1 Tax=Nocardia cyriacigeorgica TaxID=135487 RepID=UPI0013D21978|nr:saccharopine dehydrogenase NADP-binding domain-containing protein [Nocardia cyriacigeorgica]NEW28768.1 NAD(P)H-binding protein [Nocardia cyriacigeorgica]